MMAWIEPKTNWTSQDFFNIEDYNRIIGNIAYLKELVIELFTQPNLDENSVDEKDYTSMIYASEINAIENNLEQINQSSYSLEIGETKTYYPNEKTMNYEELNRIESACLLIYNTLVAHKNALKRLSFTLGGQKGIKV